MDLEKAAQFMKMSIKRIFGYYVKRPIQRFNVENRAEKVITKTETDKPMAAPRHVGTDAYFKKIVREHPEIRKEIDSKAEDLLSRLKSVKVVSKDMTDDNTDMNERHEFKERLPQSKTMKNYSFYGYTEPDSVPKGKITLSKAIEFITNHAKDPKKFTSQIIADHYHLKHDDVINILNYFKPFNIHDPKIQDQYNKYLPFYSPERFKYLYGEKPDIDIDDNENVDAKMSEKKSENTKNKSESEKK